MTALYLRQSIGQSPLRRAFLLIPLVFTCFALLPISRGEDGAVGPVKNGNTAEGTNALASLTGKTSGTNNTAVGFNALFSNTNGSENTANGVNALFSNTIANEGTAVGYQALYNNLGSSTPDPTGNFPGDQNTAVGWRALYSNTYGNNNTANGHGALSSNTTGIGNIALGSAAGDNLDTGNNNIDIGNEGVAGESATIRIGDQAAQSATFIAGINGVDASVGVPVYILSTGQLGTGPAPVPLV